jgi:hypothetical protein
MAKRATSQAGQATVANLNARTNAWWMLMAVFAGALAIGPMGVMVFFGLCSFMALREFITLSPTKPGDHRTLFWFVAVVELSNVMQYVWGKTWEGFVDLGEAFWGATPFRRFRRRAWRRSLCSWLRCAGFFHVTVFASVMMLESRTGWRTFFPAHAPSFHRCFCSFERYRVCGRKAGLQSRHPADPQ